MDLLGLRPRLVGAQAAGRLTPDGRLARPPESYPTPSRSKVPPERERQSLADEPPPSEAGTSVRPCVPCVPDPWRARVRSAPDVFRSGFTGGDHPRQPETFGCFFRAQLPASRRFADRIEAPGPKDAEFRDRSASNVCPITTLRGPIL